MMGTLFVKRLILHFIYLLFFFLRLCETYSALQLSEFFFFKTRFSASLVQDFGIVNQYSLKISQSGGL